MNHAIADFKSLSLENTGLRRQISVPKKYQTDGYANAYDSTTLWYDATWSDGLLSLTCPKLLNLETLVRNGKLTLDDEKASKPRIKRFRRHDVIEVKSQTPPKTITVDVSGERIKCHPTPADLDLFSGMNVHITVSQNNSLDWLYDHAKFHVHHHGLEAVMMIDNGSTNYTLEDISGVYKDLGLKASLVMSAPFKYGPRGLYPFTHRTKFMQSALLNAARARFLQKARAVLQCDIDELVCSGSKSIFDLACSATLGFVRFPGIWHVPSLDFDGAIRHISHDHVLTDAKPCPTKYCINPTGALRRKSWDVHSLEKSLAAQFAKTKAATYLHCREISTNWKSAERQDRPKNSTLSKAARAALSDAF